jgi:hypothetical protein
VRFGNGLLEYLNRLVHCDGVGIFSIVLSLRRILCHEDYFGHLEADLQ